MARQNRPTTVEQAIKLRRAGLTAQQVKRARIWEMVQLMARGEWETGKTSEELSARWGIPEPTVRGMAAEASRTVDFLTNDRKRVLSTVLARLHQIGEQDGNDRVQALRTILENMGELRGRQDVYLHHDPFAGWSEEDFREYAETGHIPERHRKEGGEGDVPARA
jgi:hypothetical protein